MQNEIRKDGGWLRYSALCTSGAVFSAQISTKPGKLGPHNIGNASTGNVYMRLYDCVGAPTLGTTPPIERGLVPASDNFTIGGDGFEGVAVENGLWIYLSKGIADNDNTALPANKVLINVNYAAREGGYSGAG
ncbi:MAG: hypothetical protein KGL39_57315 [Patescibacteria group bacterium]|nr:hypothetical protein [Patescibacteria group bacterium]